ncbi:DNA topoisomerase [Pectinatus frisingensis]|uniref:DNA topoisomerase n=1 Tax=Pectinatus frisingensis TaxID=865 RepID=UPI0018C4B68F
MWHGSVGRKKWQARCEQKSRAWADEKVSVHHAIITTTLLCDKARFIKEQQDIYALIAHSYLAQFYPPHCFSKTMLRIDNHTFQGAGKVVLEEGWRTLYKAEPDNEKPGEEAFYRVCKMGMK